MTASKYTPDVLEFIKSKIESYKEPQPERLALLVEKKFGIKKQSIGFVFKKLVFKKEKGWPLKKIRQYIYPLTKEYYNDYIEKNRDEIRARATAYMRKNYKKYKPVIDRWRAEHPEEVRAYVEKWKNNNPSKIKRMSDIYYKSNKEEIIKKVKAYQSLNREEMMAKWRKRNEKIKMQKRQAHKEKFNQLYYEMENKPAVPYGDLIPLITEGLKAKGLGWFCGEILEKIPTRSRERAFMSKQNLFHYKNMEHKMPRHVLEFLLKEIDVPLETIDKIQGYNQKRTNTE